VLSTANLTSASSGISIVKNSFFMLMPSRALLK
jgi:hypothetical protein